MAEIPTAEVQFKLQQCSNPQVVEWLERAAKATLDLSESYSDLAKQAKQVAENLTVLAMIMREAKDWREEPS